MTDFLPLIREFQTSDDRITDLAWSPDGTRLAVGFWDQRLTIYTLTGVQLWELVGTGVGSPGFLSWSPDGRSLAASAGEARGVLDAATGQWKWTKSENGFRSIRIDPSGQRVAWRNEQAICLESTATGEEISRWQQDGAEGSEVRWSPDGRQLAYVGGGVLRVSDPMTGETLHEEASHLRFGGAAVWSPDGSRLIAVSDSQTGERAVLHRADGAVLRSFDFESSGWLFPAWSPDGDLIAIGAKDGRVILLRGATAEVLCAQPSTAEGYADNRRMPAFSPDGRTLAIGHPGPWRIQLFDTSPLFIATTTRLAHTSTDLDSYAQRLFASLGSISGAVPTTTSVDAPEEALALRIEMVRLLQHLAALHRLDRVAPPAWILSLDAVLSSAASSSPVRSEDSLRSHPTVRALRALAWPPTARLGLVALLLAPLDLDPWRAPPNTDSASLERALRRALAKPSTSQSDCEVPPLPSAALRRCADSIEPRLLDLLRLLGPDVVANDPGLPLRLLARARSLPPSVRCAAPLLHSSSRSLDHGHAQGGAPGGEWAGIQRRGSPAALLPSQLALPPLLLHARARSNELLFRARKAGDPFLLRPTVLLLDVSPPTFGPIEALTRPAAMAVAETLLRSALPLALVLAGGTPRYLMLEKREQLAEIWTARSLEPAQPSATLRIAEALCASLSSRRDGEARVLVLSHVWFGAEEVSAPVSARALLVHYPGARTATPSPFASCAQRAHLVAPDAKLDLAAVLAELLA